LGTITSNTPLLNLAVTKLGLVPGIKSNSILKIFPTKGAHTAHDHTQAI